MKSLFGRERSYVPTVEIEFLDATRSRFRVLKVWDRKGHLIELNPAPEYKWGEHQEGSDAIALLLSKMLGEPVENISFHINEP